MSEVERGPLQTFRITRTDGKVEHYKAHQILMGYSDSPTCLHGEFDGEWKLVLAIAHREFREIRNLSVKQELPPVGANIIQRFYRLRGAFRKGLKL